MSKYTTGELAKRCGVSVRTVQFYDTKGVLKPTDWTEGGRRLYSHEDFKKLRFICVLKSIGLSLDAIKSILESDTSGKVLLVLFEEQLKQLDNEINERQNQIKTIETIKNNILNHDTIPVNLIVDMENMMKNKNKLRKTYANMTVICIMMLSIQICLSVLGVLKGMWLPYIIGFPVIILVGILLMKMYYNNAVYICPECGVKFKTTFGKFFFSIYRAKDKYRLKTRKLTCPSCGKTGPCVESSVED